MTLTSIAMLGILLSFVFLLMGVLMESRTESETAWIKGKQPVKRSLKKRAVKTVPRRRAA